MLSILILFSLLIKLHHAMKYCVWCTLAVVIGLSFWVVANERPRIEAPPRFVKDRSKPSSEGKVRGEPALEAKIKGVSARGGDEAPDAGVTDLGEPSRETVFGTSINAIDVPPGFARKEVRIGNGKGAAKWIEIEEKQEATAEATTVEGVSSLPGWIVPVGDLSPKATRGAGKAVSSKAEVDLKRNEVVVPLPSGLGAEFKVEVW